MCVARKAAVLNTYCSHGEASFWLDAMYETSTIRLLVAAKATTPPDDAA